MSNTKSQTPQEDKDIIPQEFKDWVRQTCPNWAGDGQSAIWKDGAYATYRHLSPLSSEPAKDSQPPIAVVDQLPEDFHTGSKAKEGITYPIGGYAPGNYICKCATCGKKFMGDKYAIQCEPCAESQSIAPSPTVLEGEEPEGAFSVPLKVTKCIEKAWTDDGNQGTASDWYVNGAIYMYRKMQEEVGTKDAEHKELIKTILFLEDEKRSSLQSQLSIKEIVIDELKDSLRSLRVEAGEYRSIIDAVKSDLRPTVQNRINKHLAKYPTPKPTNNE